MITMPLVELVTVAMDELPEVVAVLDQAAARLAARGIEQWPANFAQDGGKRIIALRERVERREVHLLRVHETGEPLGTISLSEVADPDFAHGWPGGPDNALYVYRMAAADCARGLRVGSLMLDRARRIASTMDKSYVRLDCSKTNTALHRYYESCDFVKVATVDAPRRKSGALFQTWLIR